uniref:Uncharacterized protein n=1 Tax=Anguilla anguilla TaxID=7936 RepID=A0A0E9QPB1_ANGAN
MKLANVTLSGSLSMTSQSSARKSNRKGNPGATTNKLRKNHECP